MDIKLTDNSAHFKEAMEEAKLRVLEECGLVAEGYAKRLCPVDTGRLRNSISHQVDGGSAYIGTNVEYAPYVELGTSRTRAKPYLKPAVTDHAGEYRTIIQDGMKSE